MFFEKVCMFFKKYICFLKKYVCFLKKYIFFEKAYIFFVRLLLVHRRGGHKIDNLSYYCSIQRNWHHKALKRCWKAEEDHDHIGPCQAQKDCKPPHWIVSARSCFLFFLQTSLHVQGPQAALSLGLCAGDA